MLKMQDLTRPEEVVFAHTIWMTHILWFLSANRGQQALAPEDLDDCFECCDDFGDDSTDTGNLDLRTSYNEVIRIKFLNGLAELLSPAKGWNYVSATALRESEDSIEIDLVRNGGFSNKEDHESQADAEYTASLRNFISIHDNEGKKLDTYRDRWDEFLRTTVTYNFRRIDKWIDDTREVFKKSGIFDILESEKFGREKDRQHESTCDIDCRNKELPDNSDLRELISILGIAKTPDLRYCAVVLAEKLSSCAELQDILSQFAVGGKMENLKRSLNFLARPITILRLLIETVRVLPNFRDIKFHCLEPPKPIRLAKQFHVTAQEAWLALGLPNYPARLQNSLRGRMDNFKSLCSRQFSVHAEIQLLLRYQKNPGLMPTLDYIGCSKKACLLCEAFLQVSPQKFRVRGRHGGCYPAWGLSEFYLKPLYSTLNTLNQLLKQRIIELLKTGSSALGQAVPQSTLVSDFNSLDLKSIQDLENARRSWQSHREILREKLTRLNDPRLRDPDRLLYAETSTLCIICQASPAKACTRCRSCAYCSKLCQEADWPSHKLLCAEYSKQTSRPMSESRLAIWFPDTLKRPRLVWVGVQKDSSLLVPYFDHFLGEHHGVLWTLIFSQNQRRRLSLGHDLTLCYNESAGIIGSPINKSVRAAAGISVPVPHEWCGPLVLLKGNPAYSFGDVTLADFRHVLDYFVTYWNKTLREEPSSNTIWGVRINCYGEQILHGVDKFIRAAVDWNIPEDFEVSLVSKLLNLPVKAAKIKTTDAWGQYPEWNYDMEDHGSPTRPEHNPEAGALFVDVNLSSSGWGQIPNKWGENIGNVLLLRDDGEDMSLEEAEALCRYCTELLMPAFSQCLGSKMSRSEVLRYLTSEQLDNFRRELRDGKVGGEEEEEEEKEEDRTKQ